jgi:hypothetical protein
VGFTSVKILFCHDYLVLNLVIKSFKCTRSMGLA